jgi:ABC-type lipoprotein release transport system permease subunit
MVMFRYAYRSLLARTRSTAITAISVALIVMGATLGVAYHASLQNVLVTDPATHIIVVSKGAASESESRLSLESANKLAVLDGVKVTARELVSSVFLSTQDYSRFEEPKTIRGIDEHSIEVHHVTLVEGKLPAPGSLEVIVGRRLARDHTELVPGYEVALPGGAGKVSGIFAADGSTFEDEVWTLRPALELHLDVKTSSSMTLVAADAARVPQLVATINASKDLDATAQPASDFRADRGGLATVARSVLILLILLTIIATFAVATTMSSAVQVRLPELGALAAIGIPKRTLARIVLTESLLLGVVGALVGTGIGAIVALIAGRTPVGAHPVEISFAPTLVGLGLVLGFAIGLIGALIPILRVRRLDVLSVLR